MSADTDLHYSKKPFVLTLKGTVTLHFMDGQTLEGEIAAQDDLNIWLTVDSAPHLIARSQIRYIKGTPAQIIEPEGTEERPPIALPSVADTSPGTFKTEPEPTPAPAQFVEEIVFPPLDEGGTLIIPAGLAHLPLNLDETDEPTPAAGTAMEEGLAVIVAPETEPTTDATAELPALSDIEAASNSTSLEETELLPSLDMDEDVTFVLSQMSDEEVSAHLICTIGPHAGEVLKLKPGITTIGRSSDNTLPLSKDKEVSRRHSIIVYEANKFVIQDQNSLNGTFVNDQLVKEPRPLQDGDILLIGVSTLKFQERPKN